MYYQHEDKQRNILAETWRKMQESEGSVLNENKLDSLKKVYEQIFSHIGPELTTESLFNEDEVRNFNVNREKTFYEGFFGDLMSATKAGLKAAGQDWKNSKEKKLAVNAMQEINKIFDAQKQKLGKALPALHDIYKERLQNLNKIKTAIEKNGGNPEMIKVIDQYIEKGKATMDNISTQMDDVENMDKLDQAASELEQGKVPDAEESPSSLPKVSAGASSGTDSGAGAESGSEGKSGGSAPSTPEEKVTAAGEAFKQDSKGFENSFFTWIKTNKDNLKDILGGGESTGGNSDADAEKVSQTLQKDPGAGKLSKEVNDLIAKAAVSGKNAEQIRMEIKNQNADFKVTDDVRHAIGKALGEVGRQEDVSKLKESRKLRFKKLFETILFEGVAEDLIAHYENNDGFIKGIAKVIGSEPDRKVIANLITKFVDSDDFKKEYGNEGEGLDILKKNPEAQKVAKAATAAADDPDELTKLAANDALGDVLKKSGVDQETLKGAEEGAVDVLQQEVSNKPESVANAAITALKDVGPEKLQERVNKMQKNAPKGLFAKLNSLVDKGLSKVGINDPKTQKIVKIGAVAVLGAAAVAALVSTGGTGAIGAVAARKAAKVISTSLYNEVNGIPTTSIGWTDQDGDGIVDAGEVTGFDRGGLGWMNGLSWDQVKKAIYGS